MIENTIGLLGKKNPNAANTAVNTPPANPIPNVFTPYDSRANITIVCNKKRAAMP